MVARLGLPGHPRSMRSGAVLILCGAVLIGACDEKGKGGDKSVKLSAPKSALKGAKPDLGRGDYRGQRGWDAGRMNADNGWFGSGQPRPLVASTSSGNDALENLRHNASMNFDNAGNLPVFNHDRAPVTAVDTAPREETVVQAAEYQAAMLSPATMVKSLGSRSGYIHNPVEIPFKGVGYEFLPNATGENYGTRAMGLGMTYLAAEFKRANPGHPGLTLGDVSDHDGGRLAGHKSHRYGRDIDIYFAITDANGRPVTNNRRISFNADGRGRHGFIFDDARNWELVKGMLENPYFGPEVEYLFISRGLEARILAAAERAGASAELRRRAARVMYYEPNHANHFHLRIKPSSRPLPIQA